jgi:predicted PurR-regulated permease PerM
MVGGAGHTAYVSTVMPPRLPPGERLRRAGIAAWSVIGLLILTVVAFWALLKISIIFPPLVLALLIIYLLNPVVARLERRGIRRGWGVFLAYIFAAGVIALLVLALSPFVSKQISQFADEAPKFRQELVSSIDDAANWVEDRLNITIDTSEITCLLAGDPDVSITEQSRCDQVAQEWRQRLTDSVGRLTEIGLTVLEALVVLILGPLLAAYILVDLPNMQRDAVNLFPETHRAEFADLGSKIGSAVGGFFRGQLLVAFLVGVLSALGFYIIGLPFWLLIGAIAGIFNLVPLIGPFIGGGIGFLVGTVSGGVGLGLKAALVELIVQQFDNHVLSPNVMKRTVQIHPVTVMLSLLAGGAVAGFWGVLLAVPGVAVAKLVLGHLWHTRILGEEISPAESVARDMPSAPKDESE